MSSTTPGSEPPRRDDEADTWAEAETAAPSEPGGAVATGEVHPAGSPDDAERIERVEPADVPPAEPVDDSGETVVFAGSDEAVPIVADPDADPDPDAEPGSHSDAEADADADAAARARLDAAVERANADAAASDRPTETAGSADTADGAELRDGDLDYPEPVAADSVRRDTYVAPTVAAGTVAGAATLAPEPGAVGSTAPPQAIYVQAPNPPKDRGNRGFGVLVGLLATLAFALLYAGAAYLLVSTNGAEPADGVRIFSEFLTKQVFWVPVLAFFLAFAVLAAILNRAAWWTWAVFGLLIGVVVYFAYVGGALLTVEAWRFTFEEAQAFIGQRWLDPFAIVAAVIARELPIWFGGWIAARGHAVGERNVAAREEYDRQIAAGPKLTQY
jgi:hypothetical protein